MDIQWHTEARQQPRIIGKDSSGRKIPGGPYTIYQAVSYTHLTLPTIYSV